MSEQNPKRSSGPDLPPGARIRAAADGEFHQEEHASALKGVPDGEARLAFERSLREAVGRAMGGPGTEAPAQLRARIEAALAEDGAERDAVVRSSLGDTRERSFWAGVGRMAAVAAVLILCVSVVIVASRQFGSFSRGPTLHAGLLASFVQEQHDRCTLDAEYATRKLSALEPAEAVDLARAHIGGVPPLIAGGFARIRQTGFTFAGMGRCAVPGEGPSVHVVFLGGTDGIEQMVSLFVQTDVNEWSLAEARCATVRRGLERDQTMVAWRAGGFVYFLFTNVPEHERAFRAALDVPAKECRLSRVR